MPHSTDPQFASPYIAHYSQVNVQKMVKESTGLAPTILGTKAQAESSAHTVPKASETVAMLQQQVSRVQQQAGAMEIDSTSQVPVCNWDPSSAGTSAAERDAWTAANQVWAALNA